MDASAYTTHKPGAKKPGGVMPKVNVRPGTLSAASVKQIDSQATPVAALRHAAAQMALPSALRGHKDWDMKFAVGLIVLVVLVNVSLTLLLGGEEDGSEDAAIVMQQQEGGEYSRTRHELNSVRPTQVYISNQDKRLLLRQLNATTTRKPENGEKTGGYHSIDHAPALSILDSRPDTQEE